MEKNLLVGIVVLILLVQLPLISSLDREDCEDLPHRYEDECRNILRLDLSNHEKELLIESLQNSNIISTIPTYPSLFTSQPSHVIESSDYDAKKSFYARWQTMIKFLLLIFVNVFFYSLAKRYWRFL